MASGLHILASRVVKSVIDAGGQIDPVEHYADIAELDRLARAISSPPIAEALDLLDAPIVIDDVELRRLSWAAREWLATDAWSWWKDDPGQLDLAYAWAMAHARDKAALQVARASERKARAEILRWARGTSANYDAIMAACRHLSPRSAGEKVAAERNPNDRSHIGPVLLALLTETPHPLDFWIFEAPSELVEATLTRIRENAIADSQRMARMLKRDIPPDPGAWNVRATKRFSDTCRAFKAKLLDGKAGVGMRESAVRSAEVDHQGGGVNPGEGMHQQCVDATDKKPEHNRSNKKEQRGIRPEVHDLRPPGNDERGAPVVR